jgi:hypothetical protein
MTALAFHKLAGVVAFLLYTGLEHPFRFGGGLTLAV